MKSFMRTLSIALALLLPAGVSQAKDKPDGGTKPQKPDNKPGCKCPTGEKAIRCC